MDQRYGTEVWNRGMEQRYGTEVWNGSFKEVWNGGKKRVSWSLFRTSYFDLPPYMYLTFGVHYLEVCSIIGGNFLDPTSLQF